jgi:hypothetical protein
MRLAVKIGNQIRLFRFVETVQAIPHSNTEELPHAISINPYPNPFNAQTKISYDLDRAGKVTLDVYDLTGRFVRTLVDDVKNAGRYSVEFDGSALASGTYFVKLQAGDIRKTQKMLLLK